VGNGSYPADKLTIIELEVLNMKFKLIILALLGVLTTPVFGQANNIVERNLACSINDGYTINDVVEVMRGFEWSEETAPAVVLVREAIAVSGSFQMDWDFLASFYYLSYADMVEKRSAFRNRSLRQGARLSDVATCGDRVRINNVRFVGQNNGEPIPDVTVAIGTTCQLNGSTLANAIEGASNISEFMGPDVRNVAVINRGFGGPVTPANSEVGYRISFNSSAGFGEAMDTMQENLPTPNTENPRTCNVGGMWVQYLIHSQNN
jgi:hypothetical protein